MHNHHATSNGIPSHHSHAHNHHTHHEDDHQNEGIGNKVYYGLIMAFVINLLLTGIEIFFGVYSGSMAIIADALHNCSDAFSILVAIVAYKIGTKKSDDKFSFGFKRAETLGSFINLILLMISGLYLLYEGIFRIISPEKINGQVIIYVSILALIIDVATAKLSHGHSHHNSNMKMLFIHNLSDALGSVGVIISGMFVILLGWNFIDGVIAVGISLYMIIQSIVSFPPISKILMNAVPDNINMDQLKEKILAIDGVDDIHHIHIWNISEENISLECHVHGSNPDIVKKINKLLAQDFNIQHSTIQFEEECNAHNCQL